MEAITKELDEFYDYFPKQVIRDAMDKIESQAAEIAELREALQRPDRAELQAEGKHPAPCAKFCEATAFGIEIRALKAENKQLRAALVDTEIAEVLPAGHAPSWAAKGLSSDSDESNAKPSEAQPVFALGDRVRIKEGLKGPAGNRRKCCGREGVIEAVLYDGGYEVELDTGPVLVGADEVEEVTPAGKCAATVDMFQEGAA